MPRGGPAFVPVFQNAVCNWRCWYCFVPFNLLNANKRHSSLLTPAELLDLYLADPEPPPMIDLTGGQPDLTPEWVPWMIEELQRRGIFRTEYEGTTLRENLGVPVPANRHSGARA